MDITRFTLSKSFLDNILANSFGIPNAKYIDTKIYVGLGIEFDEEAFEFTKEPVSKGFTILPDPIEFNEPTNGILRNKTAISWPKAEQNWTTSTEQIKYLGLYYRINDEANSNIDSNLYHYELIGVLPLAPAETVKINEKMVLNANTIQLRLSNR